MSRKTDRLTHAENRVTDLKIAQNEFKNRVIAKFQEQFHSFPLDANDHVVFSINFEEILESALDSAVWELEGIVDTIENEIYEENNHEE